MAAPASCPRAWSTRHPFRGVLTSCLAFLALLHAVAAIHSPLAGVVQGGLLAGKRGMPAAQGLHRVMRGGQGARIRLGKEDMWSRVMFSFVNPLIKAGSEHPIEEGELPELPSGHSAAGLGAALEVEWNKIKAAALTATLKGNWEGAEREKKERSVYFF